MTGFENRGCEMQLNCRTSAESIRCFERSCEICCAKGVWLSCDRCAIASTHENVRAALYDAEKLLHEKEVARAKYQKRMITCEA